MNKLPFILRAPAGDAAAGGGSGGGASAGAGGAAAGAGGDAGDGGSLLGDQTAAAGAAAGAGGQAAAAGVLPANWDSTIYDATGKLDAAAVAKLPADMADLRGFLEKYPTRADALKSIPHLQKLALGKAGLRPLPENATPEQKTAHAAEVAKFLGVPDKPEGYGITKPENLPEGITWDDKAVNGFLALAHKHAAPPALVKEIIAYQQGLVASQLVANKAQGEHAVATTIAEMRAELPPGTDWPTFSAQVDRGVAQASRISGIPVDRLNAMAKAGGLKDMSRFFASLASATGEDAMPDAALNAQSEGLDAQIHKIESNPKLYDKNAPIEERRALEAEYKTLLARKHGYAR